MLSAFLSLALAADPSTYLCLEAFEATTSADAATGEWQPLTIGAPLDPAPVWTRARASFDVGAAPVAGRWLLRIGGGDLTVRAHLNGQVLLPISDPAGQRPETRVGPMFAVPHTVLKETANLLEVQLDGDDRHLERGPAFLLSPDLAERFLVTVRAPLRWPMANLGTLASMDATGRAGARVLFRDSNHGGELRLAAQLDLTLLHAGRTVEPSSFAVRKVNPRFPVPLVTGQDPLIPQLNFRHQCFAPIGVEPARLDRARALLGEIGNRRVPEGSYEFNYALRMFPSHGGALQLEQGHGFLLLHNGEIGLYAEGAEPLGPPEQPHGLKIQIAEGTAAAPRVGSLAGPSRRYGVFAFEGALQNKRLTTILEAAAMLDKQGRTLRGETSTSALGLGSFPDVSDDLSLDAIPRVVGALMTAHRDRYAPRDLRDATAADPAWQFWGSEMILRLEPDRELVAVQAALGPGNRTETPATWAKRRLYGVLRAVRQHRWSFDGEAFAGLVPDLIAAVEEEVPEGDTALMVLRGAAIEGLRRELPAVGHQESTGRLPALAHDLADALYSATASLWPGGPPTTAPAHHVQLLCEALLLDAVPDEQRPAMLEWVLAHAGDVPDDSPAALLITRLALEEGLVEGQWERLRGPVERAVEADWVNDETAVLYGVLLSGVCGVKATAEGAIDVLPRWRERSRVIRIQVPYDDGQLFLHLGQPDVRQIRSLQLRNKTSRALHIRLGVPGRLGTGKKIMVGALDYSLYEYFLEPGAAENLEVR